MCAHKYLKCSVFNEKEHVHKESHNVFPYYIASACVAKWIQHRTRNTKVAGSIRAADDLFLTLLH